MKMTNPAGFLPCLFLVMGAVTATVVQAAALEEVVVTAQYRKQNLQNVPVSVTAFTAKDIRQAGIEDTQDFVNLTPNMTLDDSFTLGNTFLQVRGVSQINNADSPMAIVVDGVPENNQKQFKQDLYDVQRISVLRGPQGALYGRNAIGGAINIVTKAPTNDFQGHFTLGAGNGGLRRVVGAVSGPIVPGKVLFRVAGEFKKFDGLIENNFLHKKVDFYTDRDVRGKLLWNATDNLTVDLRLAYSHNNGGCCWDTFIVNPNWNPLGSINPNRDQFNAPYSNVLGKTTNMDTVNGTMKVDWDTNLGKFTYVLDYTEVYEKYFADLDFTSGISTSLSSVLGVGLGQSQKLNVGMLSHELRWTSPNDRRLRWIAGLYYLGTDRALNTTAYLDVPGTTPVFSPAGFIPFLRVKEHNHNHAWAVFGQVDYDLMDDLSLTLGLRYDSDHRRHFGLSPVVTNPSKTFSDLQPRAVLTKHWTGDVLTYASFSRGFRSGGFNSPSTGSTEFKAETLNNYEIGLKSKWLDNRLLLNAAAFYSQDHNFQFFFIDVTTASQIISNIDDVDIYGGELELQALLTPNWDLFGSFGYTHTRIQKSSKRPQDVGNHTPKNQLYTFNVGTQYTMPLVNNLSAVFRIAYERRGKKYWHPDNLNPMASFGLLNGRVSLDGQHFSLVVWARDILNKRFWEDYNASAFSGLPFGDLGFLSRGRTFGANISYRF